MSQLFVCQKNRVILQNKLTYGTKSILNYFDTGRLFLCHGVRTSFVASLNGLVEHTLIIMEGVGIIHTLSAT